ncbi:TRAP transporter small permease [Oceanobacillus sp. FSL K6-2867]|uniref:TRAP transporter small permease n=1 Tax=Oceanobacillus sp. FSL K6-2867 TaxID=2954748 RepID=UPI0030D81F87
MWKKWINNIDDFIASIALIGVISITIINVIFRYIFNMPILWAEEVSLALYVWFVFIGASSTMKRNGHIGIDYFVKRLPLSIQKVMKFIRMVVIYFVLGYVFMYLGSELAMQAGDKVTPTLRVSYIWIDVAVPLGGILIAYHFTRNIIKSFQHELPQKGDI